MLKIAEEFQIPLIHTPLGSKNFVTHATVLLEEMLAPRFSLHGTLLDIRGIGTLIRGKSGVGKSECALALIERNHSLVADDMVDIRLVSEHDLIGRIPDMRWWGFMECRGIGIINIRDLFGIRAVRQEKRIDFIITFTYWKQGMEEERTWSHSRLRGTARYSCSSHGNSSSARPRYGSTCRSRCNGAGPKKLSGHDSAKDFNDLLMQKLDNKSNP